MSKRTTIGIAVAALALTVGAWASTQTQPECFEDEVAVKVVAEWDQDRLIATDGPTICVAIDDLEYGR